MAEPFPPPYDLDTLLIVDPIEAPLGPAVISVPARCGAYRGR